MITEYNRPLLLSLALLLCWSTLDAQSLWLGNFDTDQFGGPSAMIECNGELFFSAYTPNEGRELWVTDGTREGTHIFIDLAMGSTSAISDQFDQKSIVMNGVLYFLANDGVAGNELWRTDGTPAGTWMVRDAMPGMQGSTFGYPVLLNGRIYYIGSNGNALWRSDGSADGTVQIQSFQIVGELTPFNGHLYFSAALSGFDQELWRCNGTTSVCTQVLNLNNDPAPSLPINFKATSEALYFMANTQTGWELWKTLGTAATTQLVRDINPGGANGVLQSYGNIGTAVVGNKLFFRATDGQTGFQLWQTDGTEDGTVRISNHEQAVLPEIGLPVVNDQVLYSSFGLSRFWQFDPQSGVNQESHYPARYGYSDNNTIWVDDVLIFTRSDSAYGTEVWRADGSEQGIRMVQETDLTDNWTTDHNVPGLRIRGKLGTLVFFDRSRNHQDAHMPLYVFDASDVEACPAPTVVIPVLTGGTTAHVVWNRPSEEASYELRLRMSSTLPWQTVPTDMSYAQLSDLTPDAEYEMAIRADCGQGWSDWSESQVFNTGYISSNDYLHMVAERAEGPTVMRLYWQRTPAIVNAQFRFRPFGSDTWSFTSSATGFRRIQNLQPGTLYEYQARVDGGAGWGDWPSFLNMRYFLTPEDFLTSVDDTDSRGVTAWPNPTGGRIRIEGGQLLAVTDLLGRAHTFRTEADGTIDLSYLSGGVYLLRTDRSTLRLLKLEAQGK